MISIGSEEYPSNLNICWNALIVECGTSFIDGKIKRFDKLNYETCYPFFIHYVSPVLCDICSTQRHPYQIDDDNELKLRSIVNELMKFRLYELEDEMIWGTPESMAINYPDAVIKPCTKQLCDMVKVKHKSRPAGMDDLWEVC